MLRLLRWLFLGWSSWTVDKLGSEADPWGTPQSAGSTGESTSESGFTRPNS